MSEVKRYHEFKNGVVENSHGMYVKHEDYAALQQKLDAVLAENAALKKIVTEVNSELYGQGFEVSGWHLNGDLEPLDNWFTDNGWGSPLTPATDAILNAVRADAVEMFVKITLKSCELLAAGMVITMSHITTWQTTSNRSANCSLTNSAPVQLMVAAMISDEPEQWTSNSEANAALIMLDRIDTTYQEDDDRIDGVKRVIRSLVRQLESKPANQPYKLPDGFVTVPRELTAENGAKAALIGEFKEECPSLCPECTGDDDIDDCETCDGSGRIYLEVPVSWTTIKNIWDKAVEHFTPPTDSTT